MSSRASFWLGKQRKIVIDHRFPVYSMAFKALFHVSTVIVYFLSFRHLSNIFILALGISCLHS